jgi:diguanylate cyclase (GGDEF)-like protein
LRETFRDSDIIARLGGDEFAVLAMGGGMVEEKAIRRRFEELLATHNEGSGNGYQLAISIGITMYNPSTPCTIEELLEQGDALMYECKRQKKQSRL